MPKMLQQLGALWKSLGALQKALVVSLVAVAALGCAAAAAWGPAPTYVTLLDGLDGAALGDALTKLEAGGVRCRPAAGGGGVEVDFRDLALARKTAATQRLVPEGGADLEWDAAGDVSLGLTDDQRRRRELLAKQKKLAEILQSYVGVERAAVTLTPAVKAYSRRDASPAKAAVVLKFQQGFSPDAIQIEAMQRVTAAHLADLLPENVAISDTRGALLTRGVGGSALSTPGFELARTRERYLAEKAQSALDAAFGPGKTQVRVNVTLNLVSETETKRSLDPGSKVKTQEKTSSSTGARPGGAVGAGAEVSRGAGAGSSTEENSASYEYSRTETVTRREPGEIVRLTVAVTIDATLAQDEAKVRKLVKNAVGWDAVRDRGEDSFTVEVLPFAAPEEAVVDDVAAGSELAKWIEPAKWAATGLFGLGLAWFALRTLKGAKTALAAAIRRAERPPEDPTGGRPVDPKQKAIDEIDRDPHAVGALLKTWLYDAAGAR
ncbi:MAG TPA: flagellar M-ring protein FliF C-terminal domain-containing protein [Planctomycetota bacterium]|nr:flagellar M-ring protein FliF C-terminal domain-containing protein [Planctomycetota bacterium]